jgi:hypothetical protein
MIETVKAWGRCEDDGLVRAAYTADWGGAIPVRILRDSDWQQVEALLRDLANAPAISADDLIPLRDRARALTRGER